VLQLKGFRHPVSEALVDDYGEFHLSSPSDAS
jgi:hypothetical protein